MSWYSSRWRRNNNSTATPLPTVAPTSPLSPTTGSGAAAAGAAQNGLTNPGGPQAGFAHLLPQTNASDPTGATRADRKALEPLFGPNIGAVSSGPAWTGYVDRDKKVLGGGYTGLASTDELTPEVINSWVEKSKDPTQPTTTLQALVNLKRPSLRLVPLSAPSDASDGPHAPPQQHALEFTYDADAPKVSIRVHVYLPKGHPDLGGTFSAPTPALSSPSGATATGTSAFVSPATATSPSTTTSSSHPYAKLLVFETVTEGGFGRKLKIVDGAVVELGRFEKVPAHLKRLTEDEARQRQDQQRSQVQRDASTGSEIPNLDSLRNMNLNTPTEGGAAAARRSRRFTRAFRFITPHRHRDQEHELRAAGPALAVVDVNAQPEDGAAPTTPAAPNSANPNAAATAAKKDDENGVKLTIRLVALDEQGAEMGCPNEQVTYLHVVRVGTKPITAPKSPATASADAEGHAAAASSAGGAEAQPHASTEAEGDDDEEDTRPWVVKVVKREATIGPHTFHLHEIFGLTNSASDNASEHAPAPVPVQGHTYPPTGGVVGNDAPDDPSPSEECLLCLSSPREVVLLPCRHLVACKDCALNMVEFGAGGAINQGSETQAAAPTTTGGATAPADGQDAAGGAAGGDAAAGMTTNIVNAMNTRRKRKAKGWFCPVCRQPYTSLLRLTTAPPPAATASATANAAPTANAAATPADGTAPVATTGDEANGGQNNGLLGSLRPGFFRNLTSGKGLAENGGSTGATGSAAAVAGGSSTAAPGPTTAGGAAGTSGAAEGEGEEMVQVNARVGDVESTAGLGRVGA